MVHFDSVRYSTLEDTEEYDAAVASTSSAFDYGASPELFKSAFTYARYNDLDNMGYEEPKRFGKSVIRFSNYTYSAQFDGEEDNMGASGGTLIESFIVGISFLLALITLPFSLLFVLRFVSPTEKLVILRLGRAQRTRGPGTVFVLPCIDSAHRIDTRVTAFNVPPLHIITADRGLVEMGAVVFLRVRDAIASVCQVHDRNNSTRTLANSMLYRYVSKKRMCELTGGHDRRMLAALFKDELGTFTSQFGVEITEVELSEMRVLREAENMALASLSSVAHSEVGQQVWNVIGPMLDEISQEAAHAAESKKEEEQLVDLTHSHDHTTHFDIDNLVTIVNLGIDDSLTMAISRVYQFDCKGIASVVVDLRKGLCYKGTAPSPDVIFHLKQNILIPLLKQKLSPMAAYMDGTLKITGSVQDAFSLRLLTDRIVHLL